MNSFGALQRAFSQRCVRLMVEGKEVQAKKELCEYIEYLKSKEPLIEQLYVYESFYNHSEPERDLAIIFIKETLNQLSSLTRGDILSFNTLLKHKFGLDEQSTQLDKAISLLIESKVSNFDFDPSRTAYAFKTLLNHVMKEKEPQRPIEELAKKHNQFGNANLEFFTPRRVVRLAIDKFNKEFGPLFTESERILFRKITQANTKESLEEIYNIEYKQLCSEISKFRSAKKLDESLEHNLSLAETKLVDDCTIDNLLNILELRTQLQALGD